MKIGVDIGDFIKFISKFRETKERIQFEFDEWEVL